MNHTENIGDMRYYKMNTSALKVQLCFSLELILYFMELCQSQQRFEVPCILFTKQGIFRK